jgi:hypothetical protein
MPTAPALSKRSGSVATAFAVTMILAAQGNSQSRAQQASPFTPAILDDADTVAEKPGDPDAALDSVDLSLLSNEPSQSRKLTIRRPASKNSTDNTADWSRNDRPNGSAAVTVRRNLTPFLDTRIGADLDVATQASPYTTENPLPERLASDARASRSSGSAWAALTAPGLILWDKTAVEARVNPSDDEGRLKTSLSKSLPLWDNQFSLTLRNDYSMTQHSLPGTATPVTRSTDVERSAQFGINASGTSLIAGRTLSANDRWLNKFGAEQRLPGGVRVTATISETPEGTANKGLAATFKKSW